MAELANSSHDPTMKEVCATLRELGAEVRGFMKLMDERDLRYGQSFKESKEAVFSALQAAEKQTNAAFLASEKAVVKAEDAQRDYNARTNEIRGALADQAKTMLTREEHGARQAGLERDLEALRAQISDLGSRFVSADTFGIETRAHKESDDRTHSGVETRMRTVENALSNYAGRFWAVGVIATIISISVGVFLRFVGK